MNLVNEYVPKMLSNHWLKKKVAFGPATATYWPPTPSDAPTKSPIRPIPSDAATTTLPYFEFREPIDIDDGRGFGIDLAVAVPTLLVCLAFAFGTFLF
uniref:Transmembrane protein n=1 Tax=Globodera pallida TaxID=36090 RepID=A0A183BXA9_GLOPA